MSNVEETLNQRGNLYGSYEENANKTIEALDTIGWEALPPEHRYFAFMVVAKLVRMCSGDHNHIDNVHDIAGYAKLLEEVMEKNK